MSKKFTFLDNSDVEGLDKEELKELLYDLRDALSYASIYTKHHILGCINELKDYMTDYGDDVKS